MMHQVHRFTADVGDPVLIAIDLPLAGPPVEAVGPIGQQIVQVVQVRALAPGGSGRRVRPARTPDARTEVVELLVGDVDGERVDAHSVIVARVRTLEDIMTSAVSRRLPSVQGARRW